jgi:phosphodiesterase/alkaline phosphatase D-like protein
VKPVYSACIFLLLAACIALGQPVRLSPTARPGTPFTVTFPTASNRNYMVNWTTFAPPNVWGTLTNVAGDGNTAVIRDFTTMNAKFYDVFTEAPVRYVTIGHVEPTSARLAVGLDASRELRVIYSTNPNLANPTVLGPFAVTASDDYTEAIDLTGLSPQTTYFFNLLVDGQQFYAGPPPSFRTPPPHGKRGTVKIAFGSCYNGTSAGGYGTAAARAPWAADQIWQSIAVKAPDFFLHLGDTAYCDNKGASDLNSYRLIHRHTLDERLANMSSYAHFRRHFAFYATWDDHENINDWPWSPLTSQPWSAFYLQNGKQAFREYHGRGNPNPYVPNELYYSLQFGDIGVFVTDGRSFRSCQQGEDSLSDIPSGSVTLSFNGPIGTASGLDWNGGAGFTPGLVGRTIRFSNGQTRYIVYQHSPTQIMLSEPSLVGTASFLVLRKTLLGAAQKQYLKNWLLQNDSALRVKFIATSTPINGLSEHVTVKDAWGAGYQAELNEILDFVASNSVRNVVFLSGDQHWAGSFNRARSGRNFFEFMSSPLSSSAYPRYTGTNQALLSRAIWMFDASMNNNRVENFGLVTVRTDISRATIKFELFDAAGTLLNSTVLIETPTTLGLQTTQEPLGGF